MSISSATDRLASPPRVEARHIVSALLLSIGLVVVVIAIAISSTTSTDGRLGTGPRPLDGPRSHALTGLIGAPELSVPIATFRDPVTHAALAAGAPATSQAEPGLGHR
jgi:hypothetical protein